MAIRFDRDSKPYWLLQVVGWLLFAVFNFGTRIYIFPDTPTRALEGSRFACAILATFPLHSACRLLCLRRPNIVVGLFSCMLVNASLAIGGELISEILCNVIWNMPRTIGPGFAIAESTHFFVTLCCWCALYFAAIAYFEAEDQARLAVASSLAQREAELEVLRFQIQPTFFVVGLDRIASLVEAGNPRQASMMTSQFGGLLRSMLDEREIRLADLASELVHVNDYLKIILNRSDSPLEVDFECDLEPNQILIPRWLLIPLAEATLNSIQDAGRLTIKNVDRYLTLQLRGAGSSMSFPPDFRGLVARLHEIFGDRGVLSSDSHNGELNVQIRMPIVSAINA